MARETHILICGRDAKLLCTRRLVLRSAGYHVSTTLHNIEKTPDLESVKLLVVCHTLSSAERHKALSTFAERGPGAKALCLVPSSGEVREGVCTLDSFAGPRKMLEVVKRLLDA